MFEIPTYLIKNREFIGHFVSSFIILVNIYKVCQTIPTTLLLDWIVQSLVCVPAFTEVMLPFSVAMPPVIISMACDEYNNF